MKERRTNLAAGLFVTVTLAVLAVSALLFGGGARWLPGRGAQTVTVSFDAAPGVRAGTRVLANGVPVGRVRAVRFSDEDSWSGGCVAELALDRPGKLRRGTLARATTPALGGRTVIELLPGPADEPPLEPGATLRGEVASGLASLLPPNVVWALERNTALVGEAAGAAAPLLADLQRIVEPRSPSAVDIAGGPGGNLASAITRLDDSLRRINELLGDGAARQRFHQTLDHLQAASGEAAGMMHDFRVLAEAGQKSIDKLDAAVSRFDAAVASADQRMQVSAEKLNRALEVAAEVLTQLGPAAARIGRGEGTLGKLIYEDRVYEALLLSLMRTAPQRP